MTKSTAQKVRVGIFVVIGTLLLIITLYSIGKRQHIFSKNIQLHAVFANVNGLQIGNNVRYSGINIGTVNKIEMISEGKIAVQMHVDEKTAFFIRQDAIASIGSDGLVGSMVVNIIPGKNETSLAVRSGDTINSYSRIGSDEILSTLNTTGENAALLTSDLLKITGQILEGRGTLGALVSDSLLLRNFTQTVADLRQTARGTATAVSRVNEIIEKIDYDQSAAAVILSDTVSAGRIRNVFSGLEESSREIQTLTQNLNRYFAELESGKGALNHLTRDENLVREIDSTMIYIKEASRKLEENMEAMRSNFLFRGYFKRLERRQEKEK